MSEAQAASLQQNMSEAQPANLQQTPRGNLMLGELPNEFLRVSEDPATSRQVQRDSQIAQQLAAQEMQQQSARMHQPTIVADRLFISVMEAKLNKNYGLTRMDPYCKVRVNHHVFETETSYNGAKNPTWSKSISVPMNEPIDLVYIEVMDEKSLQNDSRIAWTQLHLPERVKHGEQVDDWFPLTGKLGEEAEGTVHIVLSKKRVQQNLPPGMPVMMPQAGIPLIPGAGYYPPVAAGMPVYYPPGVQTQQAQQPQQPVPAQQGPLFTEEDVKQLNEMFPSIEEDVVKTVLEASRGNKDAAINSLLTMQ